MLSCIRCDLAAQLSVNPKLPVVDRGEVNLDDALEENSLPVGDVDADVKVERCDAVNARSLSRGNASSS